MDKIGHLQMAVFGKKLLNRCGVVLPEESIEIRDRGHIVFTVPDPSLVTMEILKILNAGAREAGWLVSLDVDKDEVHFMDIEV